MKKKVINVLDCGADPSGTSDCTAAFREALAATGTLPILVPAGTYRISGMIRGDPALQPAVMPAPPPTADAADKD